MSRVGTVFATAIRGESALAAECPSALGRDRGLGVQDAQLIGEAATGNRVAFQALVERHRSRVYRVAYQFSRNHHDADDIAQEVFLKVYRSLGQFRQAAQFTSWLYRIVMNACIDHRRRQVGVPSREGSETALNDSRTPDPDPESRAYASELGEALQVAIDGLPPRQRLIFVMRHFEELKLVEIATALGLAEGTVKRQLHAAVHRLRRTLREAQLTERQQT